MTSWLFKTVFVVKKDKNTSKKARVTAKIGDEKVLVINQSYTYHKIGDIFQYHEQQNHFYRRVSWFFKIYCLALYFSWSTYCVRFPFIVKEARSRVKNILEKLQEHDFLRDLNFPLLSLVLRSREEKCGTFKYRKQSCSWKLFSL